jgi:mono/diheme cytochrome c family protein
MDIVMRIITSTAPSHIRIQNSAIGLWLVVVLGFLTACSAIKVQKPDEAKLDTSTLLSTPDNLLLIERNYSKEQIKRGKYKVEALRCGTCHTDGALIGTPNKLRLLAGSQVGIAYAGMEKLPAVVFPGNLTSDPRTGIGLWSESDIVEMLQTGVNQYGQHTLPVMPWQSYAKITDADSIAIAAYLMSLSPVEHVVPRNVQPGEATTFNYVHFDKVRKSK